MFSLPKKLQQKGLIDVLIMENGKNVCYYYYRKSAVIHDSYRCKAAHKSKYGEVLPFPTRRDGGMWTGCGPHRVGQVAKQSRRGSCPWKCRPPQHKDWTNC